jgi:thiol-disulfide isomerase/thioredoxin
MLSLQIGPLALPVAPLLLFVSAWLAMTLASRLAAPAHRHEAGNAVFHATLVGLLAARLSHLAWNASAYATSPWSALDLRDGGWHAASGLVAGTLWLAWRGWKAIALRRPLGFGLLAGVLVWTAGSLATQLPREARLPDVALAEFPGGRPTTLAQAAGGRPAVVNLWASWCGPCRAEMPVLVAAQQRSPDVAILFANQGERADTVQAYLARERLALRDVLLDERSALGPAVGSRGLPTTLFYDAQGRLVDAHVGVLSAASLDARLQRLRASR